MVCCYLLSQNVLQNHVMFEKNYHLYWIVDKSNIVKSFFKNIFLLILGFFVILSQNSFPEFQLHVIK